MKLTSKESMLILRKFADDFNDKTNVRIISTHEYKSDIEVVFQGVDASGRSFCKFTSIAKQLNS